jgi:UDP-N-acetylmuramate dehydrogenase
LNYIDIDFKKFSSIKIGQSEKVLLIEDDCFDDEDYFIIGEANNLLVSPAPPPLATLSKEFDFIKIEDGYVKVGAKTKSGKLYNFAKKHNLFGFEILSNLPGSIGGIVKMNAGLKSYEIFENIAYIKSSRGIFSKDEIDYGYRFAKVGGVVYEVWFKKSEGFDRDLVESLKNLRKNQPKEPSAGSFFKNPPDNYAGALIDRVGLKGYRVGDISWSSKHANFLVNLGNATFDEAIKIIDLARTKVSEEFGIKLENEVQIL